MSDATYTPVGAVIRLGAPLDVDTPPRDVLARALSVPAALGDVLRPLEVTLIAGTRTPGVPILELEPEPPAHQIVQSPLPERVVIRPPEGGDRAEAAVLDAATLEAWAAEALARETAPPGLEVTLSWLLSTACWARVDGVAGDDYVVLAEFPVTHPVRRCDGAAWVPAPVDDLLMQPAVTWRVGRDVELLAELWVDWSPWLEAERPEAQRLQAAVDALRAQGWEPR